MQPIKCRKFVCLKFFDRHHAVAKFKNNNNSSKLSTLQNYTTIAHIWNIQVSISSNRLYFKYSYKVCFSKNHFLHACRDKIIQHSPLCCCVTSSIMAHCFFSSYRPSMFSRKKNSKLENIQVYFFKHSCSTQLIRFINSNGKLPYLTSLETFLPRSLCNLHLTAVVLDLVLCWSETKVFNTRAKVGVGKVAPWQWACTKNKVCTKQII